MDEQLTFKNTLETGGEDVKTTLETGGEDVKTTLETGGEDVKNTLETSGELFLLEVGKSKFITQSSLGISIPRAATSVTIKTLTQPDLSSPLVSSVFFTSFQLVSSVF